GDRLVGRVRPLRPGRRHPEAAPRAHSGGEWPRERFSALVGLAVGINQFTFAFGPSLVGVIRDRVGGDALALAACATLQALAAVMILLGPGRPPPSRS